MVYFNHSFLYKQVEDEMIYSQDMHSAIGNLSLQHESDSETRVKSKVQNTTTTGTPGQASVSMKRPRSEEELPAFQHKQIRTTSSSEEDGRVKVNITSQTLLKENTRYCSMVYDDLLIAIYRKFSRYQLAIFLCSDYTQINLL